MQKDVFNDGNTGNQTFSESLCIMNLRQKCPILGQKCPEIHDLWPEIPDLGPKMLDF